MASGDTYDDQHPHREFRHARCAAESDATRAKTHSQPRSSKPRRLPPGLRRGARLQCRREAALRVRPVWKPTVRACELKIASLERAEDALLFPTGMSAIVNTMLAILRAGHHCILFEDCYRNTKKFCDRYLVKYGVEVSFVRTGDYAQLEREIRDNTRVIIGESPTNPHLRVSDIPRSSRSRRRTRQTC